MPGMKIEAFSTTQLKQILRAHLQATGGAPSEGTIAIERELKRRKHARKAGDTSKHIERIFAKHLGGTIHAL